MREPKPPLLNQSGFQYAVFRLEPPADADGFFHSSRIVVERDRDHGIWIKAPLLFLCHLRSHERSRLETMLIKPEWCPERLAEDERLRGLAPPQPVEEGLLEPLTEEPFRIGIRDRQYRPAGIADEAPKFVQREDYPSSHAALTWEEAHAETLGGQDRNPAFLYHRMRRIHILQGECERLVVARSTCGTGLFG